MQARGEIEPNTHVKTPGFEVLDFHVLSPDGVVGGCDPAKTQASCGDLEELQVQSLTIEFRDLSYAIPSGSNKREF